MKIIREKLDIKTDLLQDESTIIFDIETTGFHRQYTFVYLIGLIEKRDGEYYLVQYFAEAKHEEKELIAKFFEDISHVKKLLSFNGDAFDIPYLNARAEGHGLSSPLSDMESYDIYKRVKNSGYLLELPNQKLKTIEEYLGIFREDIYSGKDLIEMYKTYAINGDLNLLNSILLHNKEDLIGLVDVSRIDSVIDELNTIQVSQHNFVVHNVNIVRNTLSLSGSTSHTNYKGFLGSLSFDISDNTFNYKLPLLTMNYSDEIKCQFIELDSLSGIAPTNHYGLESPDAIYILKYGKDILYKNVMEIAQKSIEVMTL